MAAARRGLAAGVMLMLAAAACGGDGGGEPETKEAWQERHGDLVVEVSTNLDRVQASTKEGEPTAIRANCEALRNAVLEAREAPPVPDAEAEGKLRAALEGVGTGANDCVRAMTSGDVRLLERSIGELRDAQLQLDTATAALSR